MSIINNLLFSWRKFWNRKFIFTWHQRFFLISQLFFRCFSRFLVLALLYTSILLSIIINNCWHSNRGLRLMPLQFSCLFSKTHKISSISHVGNKRSRLLLQKRHQNTMLEITPNILLIFNFWKVNYHNLKILIHR